MCFGINAGDNRDDELSRMIVVRITMKLKKLSGQDSAAFAPLANLSCRKLPRYEIPPYFPLYSAIPE